MCFPKALSAFATLASSPTGGGLLSSRFAFNYSEQYSHHRPNQKPPLPRNPAHFGSVPNVEAAWWSSRDLRLPSSNSVLHPFSPEPPHETTNPNILSRCASPPAGVVRSSCPQTRLSLSNFHPKSCSYHPQTTTKPILPALLFAPRPLPDAFLATPTPLNLHKCSPTGGFLQTAVSDAPRTTWRTSLRSLIGRIRYSTSVSRY